MSSSRILELAATISKSTAIIQDHLTSRNLPSPSFSPDAESLPEELAQAQDAVLDATSELHDLLLPSFGALHMSGNVSYSPPLVLESIFSHKIKQPHNLVSMNAIVRFDMANSFAPGEEASFAQIAKFAGLSEPITKSLLRHAMTMRIFCEPRKGVVAHTARSVIFREQNFLNFITAGMEEMTPAALRVGQIHEIKYKALLTHVPRQ
jgi:hypothetical protein